MQHGVGEITDVDEDFVTVGQDFVNVRQLAKMKLPCLITVEKDIYTPRLPSYRLKAATKDRKVEMITFVDFKDQDVTHYGLKGICHFRRTHFPAGKPRWADFYERICRADSR